MKQAVVFFISLLPVVAFAQNMAGMSQQQLQQMMQQAKGMQTCMQNIDQSELKAFGERAKQMSAETKALCANGERDEAMRKAMDFGKEVMANSAMQEMKKCGEGMKNMMPKIALIARDEQGKSSRHICDEL